MKGVRQRAQLVECVFQRTLGDLELGVQVNLLGQEAPGPEPPRLIIHNDRAREELGWRPRPVETTIVETAESLRDLGLLEKR